MTDKFDLRRYLIENKVTTNSKLLKEIDIEFDRKDMPARSAYRDKIFEVFEGTGVDSSRRPGQPRGSSFGIHSIRLLDKSENGVYKYAWEYILGYLGELYPFKARKYVNDEGIDKLEWLLEDEMKIQEYSNGLGVGIWLFQHHDAQISFYNPVEPAVRILSTMYDTIDKDVEAFKEAYDEYNEIVGTTAFTGNERDITIKELYEKYVK